MDTHVKWLIRIPYSNNIYPYRIMWETMFDESRMYDLKEIIPIFKIHLPFKMGWKV